MLMVTLHTEKNEELKNPPPLHEENTKEHGECSMCKFVLIFAFVLLLLVLIFAFFFRLEPSPSFAPLSPAEQPFTPSEEFTQKIVDLHGAMDGNERDLQSVEQVAVDPSQFPPVQ